MDNDVAPNSEQSSVFSKLCRKFNEQFYFSCMYFEGSPIMRSIVLKNFHGILLQCV